MACHGRAESRKIRPLSGIEKTTAFHAPKRSHIGTLAVEALLRDAEKQAIVANQRGLPLQDGGDRKYMLVPNTGSRENLLNVFRYKEGDLLLDQAGIDVTQSQTKSIHQRGLASRNEHLVEDHLARSAQRRGIHRIKSPLSRLSAICR